MNYDAMIEIMGNIEDENVLHDLVEAIKVDIVGFSDQEKILGAISQVNGTDTLSFDAPLYDHVTEVCVRYGLPYRLQWSSDDDNIHFTDGAAWKPGFDCEKTYRLVDGEIGLSRGDLKDALKGGIEGVQALLNSLEAAALMDIPQVFSVAPELIEKFNSEPPRP